MAGAADQALRCRLCRALVFIQALALASGQFVNTNAGTSRLVYTSVGVSTYLR